MYDITLNGQQLYHPNSVECVISEAVIHEKVNESGYMDITIPYNNPMYNEIVERQGIIIVYKDGTPIWYGELRDIEVDFSGNKILYVVGEASYLNDSVQPQRVMSGTKYQVFSDMIAQHNSSVEANKRFEVGMIGQNAMQSIDIVTDWEYTLDAIRNHLCGEDEFFRVRHIGDKRFIDIMPLDSYGRRSEQPIRFAENLLDYVEETSGEGIATACIPLGVTLEDGGIEGYDNYLTCAKANNGDERVFIPQAVNTIGWITRVVHFNVLKSPEALVTAGMNWLKEKQYAQLTLKLTAVDMSVLNNDIDNYALGDYVRAICEPMGMDKWFPIRERETDLLNLSNNKIVVGATVTKTMTGRQREEYQDIEKLIPNKDSILAIAKKNATALINGNGDNGYVAIRQNKDGKPYEIVVMNASSIEQSTKAWRWNLAGFGYGTKTVGNPDFTWEASLAITMDGSIVADYITAGVLRVGGGGRKASALEIYDSKGTSKLVWFDDKGMHLASGQKIQWENISAPGDLARTGQIPKDISDLADRYGKLWNTVIAENWIKTAVVVCKNLTAAKVDSTTVLTNKIKVGTKSHYVQITADGDINAYRSGDGSGFYAKGDGYEALWGARQSHTFFDGGSKFLVCDTADIIQAGKSASDERLKHDIIDLPTELSRKLIDGTKTHQYFYNFENDRLRFGMIAQEVRELFDEIGLDKDMSGLVHSSHCDDYYSVEYKEYIPHLINYVKDLQSQINDLQNQINELKGEKR